MFKQLVILRDSTPDGCGGYDYEFLSDFINRVTENLNKLADKSPYVVYPNEKIAVIVYKESEEDDKISSK